MGNSNAFMASAEKSKREQASIRHAEGEGEELVSINIRIPKELHRKARMYSVMHEENMTQLVRRLLQEELG